MKRFFNIITNWEQWPFKLLYAPISFVWGWYILRSGSVWFFTPSNPKLTFGGMEGEPKREMYELLPKGFYPATVNIQPSSSKDVILQQMNIHKIGFPCIVKPEIGGQGILFRKIDSEQQLFKYHTKAPVEYIIQEMVHYPLEVSVFYYRMPNQPKGTISGFLQKIPLEVIGDGNKSLLQLLHQNPKALKRINELELVHGQNFENVIPAGQKYRLSYAANHNRGAKFIDLKDEIDDQLVSVFDNISHSINDFFYGRYDVMCQSISDLKQGKNFSILEFNGCGAEPNHFYDTGYTLIRAYKEILKHWRVLYSISKYNRKMGIKCWPLIKGYNFLKQTNKHYKIIRKADLIIE